MSIFDTPITAVDDIRRRAEMFRDLGMPDGQAILDHLDAGSPFAYRTPYGTFIVQPDGSLSRVTEV
ncbi:hypothetical protein ACL02T_15290 [Pseudonocardia sp. RS010]|uniref:hypothetical protein n=1 Tax=Pseudonocardia sp. RS010 TaxID=3385979 RepID=UPI0039A0A3E0